MLIEKLAWASPSLSSIYAVDIHRDGTRFVTCQDSTIYIWRMEGTQYPIDMEKHLTAIEKDIHTKVQFTNPAHKRVCEINQHTQPVNCVRFSPNGIMLAAASDDKSVSLYEIQKAVDLNAPADKETEDWMCFKIFSDIHSQDVLGVEWSADSKYIATCSVDNTIVICRVFPDSSGKECQKVKVLKGHDGLVKGVAWDPIGKYLMSQGDKNVIIWSTADWSMKAKIPDPFEKEEITMFMRGSWSPDGAYVLAAGALKGRKHVAAIIAREGFKYERDVSGHKSAIHVAKFCPVLFYDKKKPSEYVAYFALGSSDKTISIWSTALDKPFIVIKEMFDKEVVDISWSLDGYKLIACSRDGTLSYFQFTEKEMGKAVPLEEMKKVLSQKYGSIGNEFALLEYPINPPLKKLEVSKEDANGFKKPSAPESSLKERAQKETITKDGKRKITPISLSEQESVEEPIASSSKEDESPYRSKKRTRENGPVLSGSSLSTKRLKRTKTITETLYIKIGETTEVKCTKDGSIEFLDGGDIKWTAAIKEGVVLAVGNTNFVAVAGKSNTLHLFSYSGRRLCNPLILGASAEFLACNRSRHLICVTTDLILSLWDVVNLSCEIQCSVDPLINRYSTEKLNSQIQVDDVGVNDAGMPIITLSNGESYTYSEKLKSWILVAHLHTPLSPFLSLHSQLYKKTEKYSLSDLRNKAAVLSGTTRGSAQHSSGQTIEDLEIGMLSAAELQDTSEYLRFVKAYAQQISATNDVQRLRDLCQSLIGPVHKDAKWDPMIAKLSKRDVVQEILSIVGNNSALQRIAAEYQTMLIDLSTKH